MSKLVLRNKKADFEYSISETMTAGLLLNGWMVKSIRAGKISAGDSTYVRIEKGEAYLSGLHIKALSSTNTFNQVNEQPLIKLLLRKREIDHLAGAVARSGYTIVLKDIHWNGHLVKATIGLGKGKNLRDKRNTIKQRDLDRESNKAMKALR